MAVLPVCLLTHIACTFLRQAGFRRQTLAFKGFLVTGCTCLSPGVLSLIVHTMPTVTVFGLVHYAESALQQLEADQRRTESLVRKEARIDLARRGIVATETAIAHWRTEREAAAAAKSATDDQAESQS